MHKSILIVEDNKSKSVIIEQICRDVFPTCETMITNTVVVAEQLLDQNWSGVVLDLAFFESNQLVDSKVTPHLAGITILQELNEMRSNCPVVIATQHDSFSSEDFGNFTSIEELVNMCSTAFPRNFKGLVHGNIDDQEWKIQLRETIYKCFY